MYRGVTKLWTPPVVYVSRARNNLSFYVCLYLHPVQSTPFSPPFSKLQRRRPTHWQCPPYPRSFLGLGLDLGLSLGVCLGWGLHCAIAFLTHPLYFLHSQYLINSCLIPADRTEQIFESDHFFLISSKSCLWRSHGQRRPRFVWPSIKSKSWLH